jgi:hypothetical protein
LVAAPSTELLLLLLLLLPLAFPPSSFDASNVAAAAEVRSPALPPSATASAAPPSAPSVVGATADGSSLLLQTRPPWGIGLASVPQQLRQYYLTGFEMLNLASSGIRI